MDEQQDKLKQFVISLQEVVECPICFGTMNYTLRQCVNGHGVCYDCARLIDKCPSCQEILITRQNTLLGKIMERLPKLCPYADYGCNAVVFDNEHQRFCEFRPFNCSNDHCEWIGCVKYLLQHVKECYDDDKLCYIPSLNVKHVKPFVINESEDHPNKTPIIFGNELFYCCTFQSKDLIEPGKIVNLCRFYHVPASKPNCNFYLIARFKKGKINFKLTCKAKVATVHSEISDEVKSGIDDVDGILVMGESDLRKFSKPDNRCEHSLELDSEEIDGDK